MAFDVGSRRRAARCARMPQIIFIPASVRDLERLREFLRRKTPLAAKRAGEFILQGLRALGAHPYMGRLIEDLPDQYREWLMEFGDSGYIARYHIDENYLTVLALRHQKEVGFWWHCSDRCSARAAKPLCDTAGSRSDAHQVDSGRPWTALEISLACVGRSCCAGRKGSGRGQRLLSGRSMYCIDTDHGRMRMIVFPVRRSIELKVAIALSSVEMLPMFVSRRPSRTR